MGRLPSGSTTHPQTPAGVPSRSKRVHALRHTHVAERVHGPTTLRRSREGAQLVPKTRERMAQPNDQRAYAVCSAQAEGQLTAGDPAHVARRLPPDSGARPDPNRGLWRGLKGRTLHSRGEPLYERRTAAPQRRSRVPPAPISIDDKCRAPVTLRVCGCSLAVVDLPRPARGAARASSLREDLEPEKDKLLIQSQAGAAGRCSGHPRGRVGL